jgi:hypothetical protein
VRRAVCPEAAFWLRREMLIAEKRLRIVYSQFERGLVTEPLLVAAGQRVDSLRRLARAV